MSERFFVAEPLSLGPFDLLGPEGHHLANVSRRRVGDTVCLFNGDGRDYLARVVALSRRHASLDIVECVRVDRELPFALEVACAVPKGDRAAFLIEKLTELGVSTFVPLVCQRSIVRPGEGKQEKFQRAVIEASKQCGRSVLMQISEPQSWATYARRAEAGDMRIMAHPGGAGMRTQAASTGMRQIAVGPEGGFSDDEVAQGFSAGWTPVSLGARILRVETAAIALASQISLQAG